MGCMCAHWIRPRDNVILAAVSLLAVACPNHSVVEPLKAPARPVSSAIGPSSYAEPLIVDWQPADCSYSRRIGRDRVAGLPAAIAAR